MSTLTKEFETDFHHESSTTQPILHNDSNVYIADVSNDFSDTTVKHKQYIQFSSSPEYETIRFSSYSNDGRRFVDIDEGISYLQEILEYDV